MRKIANLIAKSWRSRGAVSDVRVKEIARGCYKTEAKDNIRFKIKKWDLSGQRGHIMRLESLREEDFYEDVSGICEVCGGKTRPLFIVRDSGGRQISLIKALCSNCTAIKFTRRPNSEWYRNWFAGNFNEGEVQRIGVPQRDEVVFRSVKKYFNGQWKGLKVFDAGCGFGEKSIPFVDSGCKVVGVEPLIWRAGVAKEKISGEVINATIEEVLEDEEFISNNSFDLAFFFCVLEFCENPLKLLRDLHSVINEGGLLYITTGLFKYRNVLQEAFYGMIRHTFNPYSLGVLLRRAGYEVMRIDLVSKNMQVVARKSEVASKEYVGDFIDPEKRNKELGIMVDHLYRELGFNNLSRLYELRTYWRSNQRGAVLRNMSRMHLGGRVGFNEIFSFLPIEFLDSEGALRILIK